MLKRRTRIGELSAELLGTFVILIFGIGVVAQSRPLAGVP